MPDLAVFMEDLEAAVSRMDGVTEVRAWEKHQPLTMTVTFEDETTVMIEVS